MKSLQEPNREMEKREYSGVCSVAAVTTPELRGIAADTLSLFFRTRKNGGFTSEFPGK